jgi:hypothetical protein
MKTATGIDFTGDPTLAMSLGPALEIMFTGMTKGLFTGKKLADYFHGTTENWREARKIINGLERADPSDIASVGSAVKSIPVAVFILA